MVLQNQTSNQIAHESEVQRQHIRIGLKAFAIINKEKYRVHDLSSGGFSLEAKDNIFSKGAQNVKLLFNFEHFCFYIQVKAKPVHYSRGNAGFAFTELNARQISLLSYVIKSFLSGVIISEGDLLNVATRNDFVKLREKPQSNDNDQRTWLAKIAPFAAIALLGLLGVFFLLSNLYENTLIIKSPFGIVDSNYYSLRAERNGVYQSLLAAGTVKIAKDQPIAVLKEDSSSGDRLLKTDYIIKSPCDCIIVSQYAKDGEFHIAGEPLLQLAPTDTHPWVTANLSPDQILRLKLQDSAVFRIVGEGSFMPGHITEFLPPNPNKDFVQVKIKPDRPLSPEMTGRQAYVELRVY